MLNRKSITVTDLASFIRASTSLFNKNFNIYSLTDLKDCFTKNSLYNKTFNDFNLKLENDIQVQLILNTKQSQHILRASNDYLGIQNGGLKCLINPLQDLIIENTITPTTLDTSFIIQKSNESFSGLHTVTLNNIAIEDCHEYILTDVDLKTANIANKVTFNFTTLANTGYFGTKAFRLTVPMYNTVTFQLSPTTNNCVYSPADIPPDFDGNDGIDAVLGIKAVRFDASRKVFTAKSFAEISRGPISKTIIKKASTEIDNRTNKYCLCFSKIEIPKLKASYSKHISDLNSFWSGETLVLSSAELDTEGSFGVQEVNITGKFPGTTTISADLKPYIQSLLKETSSTNISDTQNVQHLILNFDEIQGSIGLEEIPIKYTVNKLAHNYNYINKFNCSLPVVQSNKNIEISDLLTTFGDPCHTFTVIPDSHIKNNLTIDLNSIINYVEDFTQPCVFKIDKNFEDIIAVSNLNSNFNDAKSSIITSSNKNTKGDLLGLDSIEVTVPAFAEESSSSYSNYMVGLYANNYAGYDAVWKKSNEGCGYSWNGHLDTSAVQSAQCYSIGGVPSFLVGSPNSIKIPLSSVSATITIKPSSSDYCSNCQSSGKQTWHCFSSYYTSYSLSVDIFDGGAISNKTISQSDPLASTTVKLDHPEIINGWSNDLCSSCIKAIQFFENIDLNSETDIFYDYIATPSIDINIASHNSVSFTKDSNQFLQINLPDTSKDPTAVFYIKFS